MTGDLKAECSRLVTRFIHLQYDAICGMSVKAGNIATDHGAKALRASVQQAKMRDMKQQRTLRDADFTIVNLNAPSVPEASITVTAVESFENEYEALEAEDRVWNGRRGHTFIMVVGPEGEWVIDDYSVEILNEERGHGKKGESLGLARTVVMDKARGGMSGGRHQQGKSDTASRAAPGSTGKSHHDADRRQARAFRRKSIRQLGLGMLMIAFLLAGYVVIAGPHRWQVEVCLYTGARHQRISVLGYTLRDRVKHTDMSQWIVKWIDPPADTNDGYYWVPYSGWINERGQPWVKLQTDETTDLALETLAEIYKHRRISDEQALSWVEEYFQLIKPVIDGLNGADAAPPLEESTKELLYLQGRLDP